MVSSILFGQSAGDMPAASMLTMSIFEMSSSVALSGVPVL
jgi:hypothetical protein